MANKESRLAQILRKELDSGTDIGQAIAIANVASLRERGDFRNTFPKSGVFGQILGATFGKGYQYGGPSTKTGGPSASAASTAGALNSGAIRITARNTMVLPAMARDMNVMKQNISSLVRATGKRAFTRPEANYNKIGPKKSKTAVAGTSTPGDSSGGVFSKLFSGMGFATSLASGIVSNMFSVLGGLLSFGGSVISGAVGILGSVLGGALTVGGSIFSGLIGGLGSIVRGMGLFGIIALAGAGFLMYQISKNITGELSFDKVMDYIKDSLGFKKGETLRDAIFRMLGSVDQKTGMNTQGAFVTVEREFTGWLAYSKSILDSIAQTFQTTGQIALNYMQEAFVTYGTAVIKILGQIAGVAIGSRAGFDVGSIIASLALAPMSGGASLTGLIGRGLFAIGSMAAGTTLGGYLGLKGGESVADTINKMLTDPMLTDEQRKVLEDMSKSKAFQSSVESIKTNQAIIDKYKNVSDNAQPGTDEYEKLTARRKAEAGIAMAKQGDAYKSLMSRYHSAFGTTDLNADVGDLRNKGIISSLQKEREALINQMPTVSSARAAAEKAQSEAISRYVPPGTTMANPLGPSRVFDESKVTSGFGARRGSGTHGGIDIAGNLGDPVYAATDGIVRTKEDDNGGKQVIITGKNGIVTGYAHLQNLRVRDGDTVTIGDQIAEIGMTGRTTGPHLHFTVKKDGKPTDPVALLKSTGEPIVESSKPSVAAVSPENKKPAAAISDYSKMSDTELMVALLGDMFGDIAKMFATGINSMQNQKGDKVSDSGTQGDSMNYYDSQIKLALAENLLYRRG